ncbi:calponin homology domain-containing protein DDB_G0272472-like [Hylaeus volcanicus]|uniref:calponin homology domain-containing protein DDB_G0272472-like n=1 Tax=Hylaeus volcanicus TaxID=313075 RepID=UPI0023B82D01|nr:calponin homology domain-containing protein DDB_G0272472-like [Hylaeus volcanicus]
MSIFPLQNVKCGPPKPRKYPQAVVGCPKGALGYRLKERNCKIVEYQDRSAFEQYEAEKRRDYEHIVKTMDFEEQTDRKISNKKVWQRVQQGLATYEEGVNARREKLRELLLGEQMGLIREVVEQAQHGDDDRMDEVRRKIAEIRRKQEEQRLALVAAKRKQQHIAQCPDLREKMAKKYTVEAKEINLAQMEDNVTKKRAEEEMERLWHDLMLKDIEAKKEHEVEMAKKRCLVDQEVVATLATQIAGKLALEEQKKQVQKEDREYLDDLLQTIRREELENLEKERRKRENLKKDLQEQILIAKRQLAERARREAEIDKMRQTITDEELAKERSNIKETSAALRKELLAYLCYLEDLRKDEAKRNIEIDLVVESAMKEARAKRDLGQKKFREAKERGLRECLRGREEQLRQKCEKQREEQERIRLEKEAMEKEIELEAKLAARAKEEEKKRRLCYKKELEEQWRYADDARRRELEEEEKRRLEESKRQEEYQRLTEELLTASENITPHPFKILLKEYEARYAAEKAGHCYCPPSLHAE